jgi:hypothetical protein
MIRVGGIVLFVAILASCGPGATIDPNEPGFTARAAYAEAQRQALTWSPEARLRWVEGDGLDDRGVALPDRGSWAFHWTAPESALELVVRVSPMALVSEEHRLTSPPGVVIGNQALEASWLDSGAALQALSDAGIEALEPPISMLLVPTRPPQWRVGSELGRRWRIHASTGDVLP